MQDLTVALQYCEILLLKYSKDKTFLLNIIKLRAIFYKILLGIFISNSLLPNEVYILR